VPFSGTPSASIPLPGTVGERLGALGEPRDLIMKIGEVRPVVPFVLRSNEI
jgi:hypothetical protein